MGNSRWSDATYAAKAVSLKSSGKTAFEYSDSIHRGETVAGAHAFMSPQGLKMRESRDSAANPCSRAVTIFLDVTGSMCKLPLDIQKALKELMGGLTAAGIADPAIMVVGIGDATRMSSRSIDVAPLQVGQFESDIKIDESLGYLYLEGGGGGNQCESYQNGFYILARHTAIDCFEKRGQKGLAIFIGDEMPDQFVRQNEIAALIGPELQDNIPTAAIVAEAQQKWDIFCLIPESGANHSGEAGVRNEWVKYLGAGQVRTFHSPKTIVADIVQIAQDTTTATPVPASAAPAATPATPEPAAVTPTGGVVRL